MAEELTIMQEFKDKIINIFKDANYSGMVPVDNIIDAVRHEIVRVLKKYHPENKLLIKEYSPKPRYCEGMQEAIREGLIVKLFDKYKDRHGGKINQCCYCPDGKNCIGKSE